MINGKPTKQGILVEYKVKEKTDTGIYIPESSQVFNGIVKALVVSPNVKGVKEGDWLQISVEAKPKLMPIEGTMYGLVQEFEVDWIFDNEPKIVEVEKDVPIIKEEDYLKRTAKEKREKLKVIN